MAGFSFFNTKAGAERTGFSFFNTKEHEGNRGPLRLQLTGVTTLRHADSAWRALFPEEIAVSAFVALRFAPAFVLKKEEPAHAPGDCFKGPADIYL